MSKRKPEWQGPRAPCHWVRDEDGFETLIPGCWGGVLSPGCCTCGIIGSELEQAEAALRIAEARNERLIEKIEVLRADRDRLSNRSFWLAHENRQLRHEQKGGARLREAAQRLLNEAVLDGMETKAGWDCWMHRLRVALSPEALGTKQEGVAE